MLKVRDLRQLVDGLTAPLRNAGASQKVLDDMDRLAGCLTPFDERTLSEFSEFLALADGYVRNGTLPAAAPAKKAATRAKTPKLSPGEAAQRVLAMYERAAADPSLEYDDVDALVASLKGLTVAELKQVAGQADVTAPGKAKKDDILREIAGAIKNRKGSQGRTSYSQEPLLTPAP